MRVSIWPVNLSVTLTRLDLVAAGMQTRARTAVKQLAEQIFWDSQNVYPSVPVDTSALKSTGRVEKVTGGYAVVYGGVVYGGVYGVAYNGKYKVGKFVDYANQVHDDLRPRKYKMPGSGPKFVEAHYDRRTSGDEGVNFLDRALDLLVRSTGLK